MLTCAFESQMCVSHTNHTDLLNLPQHHGHCSQHWCSRDTTSRTGHHGDSANIRGVANWWHHSHHCGRLGTVSSYHFDTAPNLPQQSGNTRHLLLSHAFLRYRDRFRTMVNVMGDALATGIMAHICRKDFMKEGDGVSQFCKKSTLNLK